MKSSSDEVFDLLIIGGGVNGAGIARDAAGRGFSVCLCEANNFASGTSSASSKLIHGGLRYLEQYEFKLVREALTEREVMLSMAPHIVKPMHFILPHLPSMRPGWMLRFGLFIYDHLGGRKILPPSKQINLRKDVAGTSLKRGFKLGFEYSDCWVDDSRLVILNAVDAVNHGAQMNINTKVENAVCNDGIWELTIRDSDSDKARKVRTKLVINAAGPWIDHVLESVFNLENQNNIRLVRGSHIVVNKLFDHDKPYIFQNEDNRIVFAIPYLKDYTLIGTTDVDHGNDMNSVEISDEEVRYLCDSVNAYFEKQISEKELVWTYSGVRPLFNDGEAQAQEATRGYTLKTNTDLGAPIINIFGGKITTYRRLAEKVMEQVETLLGAKGAPWTANSSLPGGEFAPQEIDSIIHNLHQKYAFLSKEEITRLAMTYGTEVTGVLGDASSKQDLGQHFGEGLYQKEVEYLIANEWAKNAKDVLFRCTRLGVGQSQPFIQEVDRFVQHHRTLQS